MKALALAAGLAVMTAVPAAADGCEALTAALLKGLHTPWHSTVTLMVPGKPLKIYQYVTLETKSYSKVDRAPWKRQTLNLERNEAQIKRDWANGVCRPGGTETIAGEAADILLHHQDEKFWLSQTTGLLLKTETHKIPAVVTSVYSYTGVEAPVAD